LVENKARQQAEMKALCEKQNSSFKLCSLCRFTRKNKNEIKKQKICQNKN